MEYQTGWPAIFVVPQDKPYQNLDPADRFKHCLVDQLYGWAILRLGSEPPKAFQTGMRLLAEVTGSYSFEECMEAGASLEVA